jgi:beta-phosphoglucomutase-like phosphatase (HAD superfamily)
MPPDHPAYLGVLFDCDGTLMDSLGRALESYELS